MKLEELKPGMSVKVVELNEVKDKEERPFWTPEMDEFAGKEFKIARAEVCNCGCGTEIVRLEGCRYSFIPKWLKPVE